MYAPSINECFISTKKFERIVNTIKMDEMHACVLSADVQLIFIQLLLVYIRSFRKSPFSIITNRCLNFPESEKRHLHAFIPKYSPRKWKFPFDSKKKKQQ